MSAVRTAFPVLTRGRRGGGRGVSVADLTTRMTSVSQTILSPLRSQLQDVLHQPLPITEEGILCALQVGADLTVPLTIIGSFDDSNSEAGVKGKLVVHTTGLPGGFVVSGEELVRGRARLRPPFRLAKGGTPSSLGSICLMEAVTKELLTESNNAPTPSASPRGVLDVFYRLARRRHFSLVGMCRVLDCGSRLHPGALQLDFPYQCGGAQATKRYLDITDEVTNVFGAHMRHGTKVLSRYGVAVSVGVVDRITSMTAPTLMWHPSGAPAACLAPMLLGCPVLPLGTVALDYNGPVPGSPLTMKEDPRRYMNFIGNNRYDNSVWLTKGLFGVKPGDSWSPPGKAGGDVDAALTPYEVVGVRYDEVTEEMELLVRDTVTNEVVEAADV
ncbi:hypothetical protein JIQ42_03572 [Leishmania sp. Namibia]|uniref:hypothetical protein n=1 Tax=Leishmania sp. Namibia TaxID=2802991 RepID=UPI001B780749|nr:hypothetical protein JIQ42_03572 [Leishmania sp. Namibia]